jgi:3-methyladenine DNA glycosylase AlkD
LPDTSLHRRIIADLIEAGRGSPYAADANESDPRYLGYGVRAGAMQSVIARYKPEVRKLDVDDQVALATALIESGYGEQKRMALHILEQLPAYFTPDRFDALDSLIRQLHGWSKIDSFTGSVLKDVLERHPKAFLALVRRWNSDRDLWMRRASVVLFTRKVARSGQYTDVALELCDRLKHDPQDMVRKGVGWCLKDMMRADKKRVLDYVVSLRRQGVSSVITLYALRDIKGAERAKVLARRRSSKETEAHSLRTSSRPRSGRRAADLRNARAPRNGRSGVAPPRPVPKAAR